MNFMPALPKYAFILVENIYKKIQGKTLWKRNC